MNPPARGCGTGRAPRDACTPRCWGWNIPSAPTASETEHVCCIRSEAPSVPLHSSKNNPAERSSINRLWGPLLIAHLHQVLTQTKHLPPSLSPAHPRRVPHAGGALGTWLGTQPCCKEGSSPPAARTQPRISIKAKLVTAFLIFFFSLICLHLLETSCDLPAQLLEQELSVGLQEGSERPHMMGKKPHSDSSGTWPFSPRIGKKSQVGHDH